MLTVVIVVVIAVAAVIVSLFLKKKKDERVVPETPPAAMTQEEAAEAARARTRALVKERMEDPVYVKKLDELHAMQVECAKRINECNDQLIAWRRGFVATNLQAAALLEQILELQASANPSNMTEMTAAQAKFEALCSESAECTEILKRREAIIKEREATSLLIKESVGERIRTQRDAHAKEFAEESRRERLAREAAGLIKKPAPQKAKGMIRQTENPMLSAEKSAERPAEREHPQNAANKEVGVNDVEEN